MEFSLSLRLCAATFLGLGVVASFMAVPSFADGDEADALEAWYAGVNAGYAVSQGDTAFTTSQTTNVGFTKGGGKGAVGGVTVGYMPWQHTSSSWGWGVEAMGNVSDLKHRDTLTAASASPVVFDAKMKYNYGLMGVASYAFSPTARFVMKAGWAASQWNYTLTSTSGSLSSNATLNGVQLGMGALYGLGENMYFTPSVTYTLYKKRDVTMADPSDGSASKASVKPSVMEAKVGVTWTF